MRPDPLPLKYHGRNPTTYFVQKVGLVYFVVIKIEKYIFFIDFI